MPKIKQSPKQAEVQQKSVPRLQAGLMSCCHTAVLIEMGSTRSTVPATKHHALCRRGVQGPRSTGRQLLFLCKCPCHDNQDWKCLECREIGTNIDETTGICTNTIACERRKREAVAAWWASRDDGPIFSGMSAKDRTVLEDAGLGPILLTPGQCECCGEDVDEDGVTAFLQGHAARLKRQLSALSADGDVEALAEMSLRGWLDAYQRNKINEAYLIRAETLLGSLDDPVQWTLNRAVARWN